MDADDVTLLEAYVRRNDQEAFAALVSRHINLVYAVALRQGLWTCYWHLDWQPPAVHPTFPPNL